MKWVLSAFSLFLRHSYLSVRILRGLLVLVQCVLRQPAMRYRLFAETAGYAGQGVSAHGAAEGGCGCTQHCMTLLCLSNTSPLIPDKYSGVSGVQRV